MEHRGREQVIGARWLVLQARFPLFALGRRQRVARAVGIGVGVERLGIADVRRKPIVEQVKRAGAACRLGTVIADLGTFRTVELGNAVFLGGFHPVLAKP
ncbi:hypothetical protein D3C76_502220 [compost metagenome]